MPLKNSILFTALKTEGMPGFIYRLRFFIALALAALLLLASCTKEQLAAANKNLLEQYFEDNILNQNFSVQLATDSSADLTAQYNGYTFKLLKNTLYDGQLTATSGSSVYTGSWSCNSDYSKLTITLPSAISSFTFLTREWRFTKKAVPVM